MPPRSQFDSALRYPRGCSATLDSRLNISVRYCTAMARRRNYSVTVYLDRVEFLQVKELANQTGESISKVGRDLLLEGLGRKEEKR